MTDAGNQLSQRVRSPRIWLAVTICLAYALLVKLLPYLFTLAGLQNYWFAEGYFWSFTPLLAVGLFSGVVLANRWAAAGAMLLIMLASDLSIGLITGHMEWAFYDSWQVVYCCILATVVVGYALREHSSWAAGIGAGIGMSVVFYIVTNFFSWITLPEYSKDAGGLIECYIRAIPFFRNMLLGTLFYSAILFSPAVMYAVIPDSASKRNDKRASQATNL